MKTILYLLIYICPFFCYSQIFEGKITYDISYLSKNPQLSQKHLTGIFGSTQQYFIRSGNYKSVSNGTLLQWQMYNNIDNKLYTKMSNSEFVLWNDAGIQADEILKTEHNKNAVNILGYICNELILYCKSGVQKYYYNSKIAVNTNMFKNHKFGNWHAFINQSKSLPLKMVIENDQFIIISVATEVVRQELTDTIFKLPVGIKLEKSPN